MKKFKKMCIFLIVVILAACFLACDTGVKEDGYARVIPPAPDPSAAEGQLKVVGNKIFNAQTGEEVRLTGANVWEYDIVSSGGRYKFARSMDWAYNEWHANIIRLPLEIDATEIYTGSTKRPQGDIPAYLDAMKDLVQVAVNNKKYVILDLHEYIMLRERDMSFWRKWAQVPEFANNPYVIFGLLNEPHDVSWETWRNGGYETPDGEYLYGLQQCLEMIRDLGAKNIVIAAGLDWGYDLRGVVGQLPGDRKNYALIDQGSGGDKSKTGYGIIYDTHIYPWKGMQEWFNGGAVPGKTLEFFQNDWALKNGGARKAVPVICGECGWQFSDTANILNGMFDFRRQDYRNQVMEDEFGADETGGTGRMGASYHANWMPALLRYFDDDKTYGSKMNYTAWCWSLGASPILLRPTSQSVGNDPKNYGHYDADVAAQLNLLNSGSRDATNPLTPAEEAYLYAPNYYSGQYFYDHMRQAARDRGEPVDNE